MQTKNLRIRSPQSQNAMDSGGDGAMKGRRGGGGGTACLRHHTVYCQQLNNAGAPVCARSPAVRGKIDRRPWLK